jgi:hypothetical protein
MLNIRRKNYKASISRMKGETEHYKLQYLTFFNGKFIYTEFW